MWKPFDVAATEPRWVEEKPVAVGNGREVEVTAFQSGWCPAANLVYERARRASEDLGTDVRFTTIDTSDRETLLSCGHSDEVFVNGRPLQRGAPPSYKTIRRKIQRQLRRRPRHRPPAQSWGLTVRRIGALAAATVVVGLILWSIQPAPG